MWPKYVKTEVTWIKTVSARGRGGSDVDFHPAPYTIYIVFVNKSLQILKSETFYSYKKTISSSENISLTFWQILDFILPDIMLSHCGENPGISL